MTRLPDRQKAAVLMHSLTREASASLFGKMSHDMVLSLNYVPHLSQPERAQVLQEFLSSMRRLAAGLPPVHDLAQLAEIAKSHPSQVVRVLRKTWPGLYREVMQRRSRVLRHPSKLP